MGFWNLFRFFLCDTEFVRKEAKWTSSGETEIRQNYLKVSTTWQLLSYYRGWTWLCQSNPKTPSKKPLVKVTQFCTRILQGRGMGSEWMNHQFNSLFRAREAAASLSQAVLLLPPNIFHGLVPFRQQSQTSLDRAMEKNITVNLIRAIKNFLTELSKRFKPSTYTRAEKPAVFSLCSTTMALLSQVTVTVQGADSFKSTLLMSRTTHRLRWY